MAERPTITVIGAGMVGTCCALYLQDEGFAVTLLDRGGPGEGASSGNLGGFGVASCPPMAMPGVLRKVPGMLLDADAPLRIRPGHAPRALPWLLRFAANARRGRVEANAAARQSLLDRAHEGIDPLVAEAGAGGLMSRTGLMFTFESEAAFRGAAYAFDLRRRNGVRMDLLDGNEARQAQPALAPTVVRAWRVADFSHTLDPLRLVQALAGLFRRRGGTSGARSRTGSNSTTGAVSGPSAPATASTRSSGWWSRPGSGRGSSPRCSAPGSPSRRSGAITRCSTTRT